jgi:guanylate kinase
MSEISQTTKKGRLFIVSAPSGSGKSTILAEILKKNDSFYFSISYTTRKKRVGEIDGINYHFISKQDFIQKVRDRDFLEYAIVHAHYYGTPIAPIEENLTNNKACFLDIDIQGKNHILKIVDLRDFPWDITTIFILPPSEEVLEQRLRLRDTDSEAVIQKRLEVAKTEMKEASKYDYQIINDTIEDAVGKLKAIIRKYGFQVI